MTQVTAIGPGGTTRECFGVALRLGLTSFGGPVAHIGYFQRCYVEQRQWLSAADFSGLVALCQVVPGPASSQLGCLIGYRRAGWGGALAAWAGFTLPSALAMTAIAIGLGRYAGPSAVRDSLVHAFTLVAVAVVAQAVVTMARSLCPDWPRAMIAIAAMTLVLGLAGPWATLLAVVCGALAGVVAGRRALRAPAPTAPRAGKPGLAALLVLPVVALAAVGWRGHGIIALAAIFARTGALVFGGGHVVLPLLRDALVPGQWISDSTFLAGYGVVQAMPGPLFTFAAYLGAACAPVGGGWGLATLYALVATIAIFLPGLLLAIGAQSVWQWLGHHVRAQTALAGINAAVVGVLAAALINPVARSALLGLHDCVIAAIGLILLLRWRIPPIVVVGLTLLTSVIWR